jgi:hypothetical protein
MGLLSVMMLSSSFLFVYFSYPNHWSTTRGIISQRLTEEYLIAGAQHRQEILKTASDHRETPETYFSTMAGKQFEVLDKGFSRGILDLLFYRGNDMTTQFLPDAQYFKDSILAGKFPVWNPWIMAGMPYLLDPQNFLWYPPNYLLLLMPLELGFLILLVGHLALAGWGTKKILDGSGISGRLKILGMGMFVLSPKLIGYIEEGNWTLVIAACWLPFLYWALKNKRFNWIAVSLSAIIINNLNIGYYAVLFAVLYYLIVMKRTVPPVGGLVLRTFVSVALLTVPRWLPLTLFGSQTVRANLQEAPLPFWSWMKIAKSLFFPLAGGHPVLQNEEILYAGIIPILLIVLFIVFKGRIWRPQCPTLLKFWIVWLGFISLVAVNLKTPFFYLIKFLPGFSLLRITTRPWIFVSLALAVGVPVIVKQIREIRGIGRIRVDKKMADLVIGALSGIILLELVWFDWRIFSRREIISDPVQMRFYRQMAETGTRVRAYCTTGCLDRLTAQKMGIALLGGNNPVQMTQFVNYLQTAGGYKETGYFPILPPYTVFNQQPQPDAELLGQTATKFVISPYELKDDKLKLIDQEQDYRLYQNMVGLAEYKDHYFSLQSADRQSRMKN